MLTYRTSCQSLHVGFIIYSNQSLLKIKEFSNQDQRNPTIISTGTFYICIKYGEPDQTGITTILPCLFVHNLVCDTNDLECQLHKLLFMVVCLFKFGRLSTVKHTVASVGLISIQ